MTHSTQPDTEQQTEPQAPDSVAQQEVGFTWLRSIPRRTRAVLLRIGPGWLWRKRSKGKGVRKYRIIAVIAALAAVLASINDVFDLRANVSDTTAPEPSVEATYKVHEPSAAGAEPSDGSSPSDQVPTGGGPGETGIEQVCDEYGPVTAGDDTTSGAGASIDYGAGFMDDAVHSEVIEMDPALVTPESVAATGAYNIGGVPMDIVISNPTDLAMTIHGMTLEVDRQPMPTGTLWTYSGGLAPGITSANLVFDLNEEVPQAVTMSSGCTLAGRYFQSHQILIEPGGTEIITVHLLPGQCLCLVRTQIEYAHDNEWKTIVVPGEADAAVPVVGYPEGGFQMVYAPDPHTGEITKYDCRTGPVHSECIGAG